MNQQGFTLIELIITLIIMSLLAVSAYIAWPTAINLPAEAFHIVSDIRYTETLSMTKNQRYRFVKISTTTYQILNSSGTPVTFPSGSTTMTLNSGITFGTFTNLPNNLIAFDGKGTPYIDTGSPGTALATTATIPLTASGQTKTISISPETGRLSIS